MRKRLIVSNRKGVTVQNLGTYALAFATAVIIVAILAQVLGQIRTTQQDSRPSLSVDAEAITFTTNNTYYGTAHSPVTSLTLYLGSNTSFAIPTARYGSSTSAVRIYANGTTAGVCWTNITAGCTYYAYYSYDDTYAENVTTEGLEGLETMGEWFPTIATIIAAVVIIVLIVSGFRPTIGSGFEGF